MTRHRLAFAAIAASAIFASAPALALSSDGSAAAYAVPVSIQGIAMDTAAGKRAFVRRAHRASLRACGLSQGRGATDDTVNKLCREGFVSAALGEAGRRAVATPVMAANSAH